ncbi:hypothetical protein DH2020_048739 [Rehmannia glutinosa]|uniref:Homeobox domain-containing protein n=1 Tax=Rehmannia glutinosa TaxID=99300 RepID=A0ABR0U4V6_REHGL
MELALSLGDTPKLKPFSFLNQNNGTNEKKTGLSGGERRTTSLDRPVQALDLLPFSPVHRITRPSSNNKFPFPWLSENLVSEPGRGLEEVNRRMDIEAEEGATISSQNNTISSFQMDFSIFRNGRGKRDFERLINNENEADRGTSSRGSDEDENGISRKKLRLTKEQSAFLEESFKEHNTLNPKQKQSLAKQLNLRPRQVEVWFQNRRASIYVGMQDEIEADRGRL